MPTIWTEHKLLDSALQRFRKALLYRGIPMVIVAVGVGLFVGRGPEGDPLLALGAMVLVGAAAGFGTWRGFRRQLESFRTLQITLTDEWISREQKGFTPLRIDFSDIRRIVYIKDKGLTVFGEGSQNFITMPEEIEDFALIRSRLEAVRPLQVRAKPSLAARLSPLIVLLILLGFAVVAMSEDKVVVLGLGIPLIVILGGSILMTMRSPQIDERTRKLMWIGLLPLIALLVKILTIAGQ